MEQEATITEVAVLENLISEAINCAYAIVKETGPGLLEHAFVELLSAELKGHGHQVELEVALPVTFHGTTIQTGCRIDMLVDGRLIIEAKASDTMSDIYARQLGTYLFVAKQPLGLLINFGMPYLKDGIRRVINPHRYPAGLVYKPRHP